MVASLDAFWPIDVRCCFGGGEEPVLGHGFKGLFENVALERILCLLVVGVEFLELVDFQAGGCWADVGQFEEARA